MHLLLKVDLPLALSTILLLILGLTILSSVSPELLPIQITAAIIGIISFFIISNIDYRFWIQINKPLYIFCLILLILPFIFGTAAGGSTSWLQFGQISLQPSEIVRPFILIIMAGIISHKNRSGAFSLFKSILILIPPLILIFKQPDLGLTITILVGWVGIIITKGLSLKQIIVSILIVSIITPLSWQFLQEYQKDRILTFIYPDKDPLNTGYQVLQSQIAVGSGQIWGRGLGRGTQSHLRFLPERHNDFIFASLAEELGLLGSLLVLTLYFIILSRFVRALTLTQNNLGKLVIGGLLATTLFQIFVNIGMNLGLLPITGVTLPLLSYGGSSIISTFIILGLVNNLLLQSQPASTLHIH